MDEKEIVDRFRVALDQADWSAVLSLLAHDCEYVVRGATTQGRDAIIESYSSIDEWAKRTFESVRYESACEKHTHIGWLITFRDVIEHRGHRLDHTCQQRVELDASGQIRRIEHIDLPGEREKVDRFNRLCGVEKPE
ncbi:MAG: nuclear transport factor 2 family protein [Phycisphaerales bacterium JB043]